MRDDETMVDETPDGPEERVGLGRVVNDTAGTAARRPTPDDVEEASSESFPASDPPAFGPAPTAPADGPRDDDRGVGPDDPVERPDPRDVP